MAEEPVHVIEFRSCPGCRGYKKLEITCPICKGEGSIDPRGAEAHVNSILDAINEAGKVAILPTEEFKGIREQAMREQTMLILQYIRQRARNMGATQDYVGEHRLNHLAELLEGEFEIVPGEYKTERKLP